MQRVNQNNPNTKDYLNKLYADPTWRNGYGDAIKRLQADVDEIDTEYPKHLDIGCADGSFTKMYIKKFPQTEGWGVDISDVVINDAESSNPNLHFVTADCYALSFEDQTFDMVHSAEMLEHLEDPKAAIKEMNRVLKTGGDIILTTINKNAAPYSEHLWTWTLEDVIDLFEGFKITGVINHFNGNDIFRITAKKI